MALLLLPHDAPRDDWLAARRQGITASEIAVILGISPWDSPFNLYWRKLGEIPETFQTDAMSLGTYLEPWIADRWAEDHPEWWPGMGGLWASDNRPWQLCTPDRLLFRGIPTGGPGTPPDPDESVLEIKSAGSYDGWGPDGSDLIPPYYRAQVLWQLDTLGLEVAHVTCFFLATRSRRDYVVAWDHDDIAIMRHAARQFLDRLERRDPPPVDDHSATTAALKALWPKVEPEATATVPDPLADDWAAACAAYKQAEARKKGIENRLRSVMNNAKYAVRADGSKVATRSVYEVGARAMPACTVDKLTAPRTPKETQ